MPEHHPAALPKGHRIGEYEIIRVLGAGGFGITYLAFDHQLDGPVALKEYFPSDAARRRAGRRVAPSTTQNRVVFAWGLDRFIEEARAIHRLRHPNVVTAHRYLKAHGTAYIVMEYVEGRSLERVLDGLVGRQRLSVDQWRRWLDALLDGLAHVHDHGFLHRDIKPANVMIRAGCLTPVLIDFGAARMAARDRTHTQVLTHGYAPLEQYSRDGVQGPPTDIYAMAAVSYRVLTGKRLSSAPDRVLADDYEPLANRIQGADRRWLAAIDHGLALRPEDRPQEIPAWRAALIQSDNESAGTHARTASSAAPSLSWKARMTGFLAARAARLRTSFDRTRFWWPDDQFTKLFRALISEASAMSPAASRFWRGCGSMYAVEAVGALEAANRRFAVESKPDSTRLRTSPPQFESFSRLTGRMIAYGGAHAVPIDRDSPFSSHNGYVDLMETCYLETGEEPELSLPEQEESLLMTFYSMYSALQCGDHGFDRLTDEVLDSLGDEDDHDDYDAYESWRDEEFKEIEAHLVRSLERCGEDRTEVRGYVSSVDDWIAEHQDPRDGPEGPDELESDVSESIVHIEASTDSITQHLSTSAAWFDEWEKSEYAIDAFVDCIHRLRLLHENRFEAAKTRVERAIVEIAGPSR